MSHVLIVGGTGMLKDVSLYFANHGFIVSVIARNQKRLDDLVLMKGESGFINPIKADYTNYNLLKEKILEAINSFGNINTVVCWIHSTAPEAPYIIAELLNEQNLAVKYFHILGGSYSNPSEENKLLEENFFKYKNISYKKIILGFVIEENHSRWLTNEEISNGVIDGILKDEKFSVVGTVEPWKRKP